MTAEIFDFWEFKYRKIGYCAPVAKIFADTIARKSAWIHERLPHRLPNYLRYENKIATQGKRIKHYPRSWET